MVDYHFKYLHLSKNRKIFLYFLSVNFIKKASDIITKYRYFNYLYPWKFT